MTDAEILARAGSLKTWKRSGQRAPQKPLLVLLALGRLQRGEPRLAAFTEIEPRLNDLLEQYGAPSTRPTAQYPFWRLQHDGLWEVESPFPLGVRRGNTDPKVTELRREGVRGGFAAPVDLALRADPELVSRVVRTVLDEHFPSSLHSDILGAVGLDAGVAEPAQPYAARPRRDPGFAPAVLRAYEHRCAVCAYDGQVGRRAVGIEAAHVKWFSHGGPDLVENGLALCSLHHKAFDLGAIAISDDHEVLVSRDFRGGGEWEARFLRVSGARLVGPQAGEPPVRAEFAAWHRKEVFRGPHRAFQGEH